MHPQRQTSCLVVALLFSAACAPLLPTPDEFPEPPMTPIVEFPTTAGFDTDAQAGTQTSPGG